MNKKTLATIAFTLSLLVTGCNSEDSKVSSSESSSKKVTEEVKKNKEESKKVTLPSSVTPDEWYELSLEEKNQLVFDQMNAHELYSIPGIQVVQAIDEMMRQGTTSENILDDILAVAKNIKQLANEAEREAEIAANTPLPETITSDTWETLSKEKKEEAVKRYLKKANLENEVPIEPIVDHVNHFIKDDTNQTDVTIPMIGKIDDIRMAEKRTQALLNEISKALTQEDYELLSQFYDGYDFGDATSTSLESAFAVADMDFEFDVLDLKEIHNDDYLFEVKITYSIKLNEKGNQQEVDKYGHNYSNYIFTYEDGDVKNKTVKNNVILSKNADGNFKISYLGFK